METFFHIQHPTFQLSSKSQIIKWLEAVAQSEKKEVVSLSYVFCTDEFLLQLNQQYLHHDTLTDVITFTFSEKETPVEGEIYISIDRVKENAQKFDTKFNEEVRRIMVHGLLHLVGYDDKTAEDKTVMTQRENLYLAKFANSNC